LKKETLGVVFPYLKEKLIAEFYEEELLLSRRDNSMKQLEIFCFGLGNDNYLVHAMARLDKEDLDKLDELLKQNSENLKHLTMKHSERFCFALSDSSYIVIVSAILNGNNLDSLAKLLEESNANLKHLSMEQSENFYFALNDGNYIAIVSAVLDGNDKDALAKLVEENNIKHSKMFYFRLNDGNFVVHVSAILDRKGFEKLNESVSQNKQYKDFPDLWNLPAALSEPTFLSRSDLLEKLSKCLTPNSQANTVPATLTALTGMAGVGKTELAKHVINCPPHQFVFRAWLSAESKTTLLGEYQRLAQAMRWCGSKKAPSEDALVKLVQERLAQYPAPGWLLAFNNVDNIKAIKDLLPIHGGRILLTSRRQDWLDANTIEVGLLTLEEAVKLLGKRRGGAIQASEQTAAEQLVQALGYLPLAITQAAAYIRMHKKTIVQYLELFKECPTLMMAKNDLGRSTNQAIATTWETSFMALQIQAEDKENPKPEYQYAQELLVLCAYLPTDIISKQVLQQWLSVKLPEDYADPIELMLDTVLSCLLAYSLIERNEKAQTISLHCLLKLVLREKYKHLSETASLPITMLSRFH
jgi:hypothetical protein